MSLLYPRTISITRANTTTSVGLQGYQGETQANETTVVSGLPASIQSKGVAGTPLEGLPADIRARTVWRIFVPGSQLALGVVLDRDVVTDDLGDRYQVTAAYWNFLGHNLMCEKLEV
jgi:hypothetical protein